MECEEKTGIRRRKTKSHTHWVAETSMRGARIFFSTRYPSIFSPPSFLPLRLTSRSPRYRVSFPIFSTNLSLFPPLLENRDEMRRKDNSKSAKSREIERSRVNRVKCQQPTRDRRQLDSFSRLREFRGIGGRLGRRNNSFARKDWGRGVDDARAMKIRRVSADYTTRRASRVVLSRQLSRNVAGKFSRVWS